MYECSPNQLGPGVGAPPPRHVGGRIVYADYDGCVHPSDVYWRPRTGPFLMNCPGHSLFEHAALLERELTPYPEVRLVLSTSWVLRYRGSVRRVAARLGPSLAARVVGATFHSGMNRADFEWASRGQQVWADVIRRKPRAWLALDDDVHGWPLWCQSHLVQCDPMYGLSTPDALAQLRHLLEEMHKL
ncbi:HAD domain-containing protein [Paraburkholderia sp. MPAMCS5]|uniref:HAD domain-containing protein n=1 Tax=Paraburkholderia sp. MPAMCS5 TaxID=3112563 RepID=UPI002E19C74F|nr:HAD domain-containing protein [Paraburkholderia sp. MPAMCS5]